MVRFKTITAAAITAFTMLSCTVEKERITIGTAITVTLEGQTDAARTTYSRMAGRALWEPGAEIGVAVSYSDGGMTFTDPEWVCFKGNNTEAVTSTGFTGTLTDKGSRTYTYRAVYPYTPGTPTSDVVAMSLPARQRPADGGWDPGCDIMVSKPVAAASGRTGSGAPGLSFAHVMGWAEFILPEEITKSAEYSSDVVRNVRISTSTPCCGKFRLALHNNAPSVDQDAENSLVLDFDGSSTLLKDACLFATMFPGTYASVLLELRTDRHVFLLHRNALEVKAATVVRAAMSWRQGEDLEIRKDDGKSIDILLFGHSFGVDATTHIPGLLEAAGIKDVCIARLYQANCSLEEHFNHLANYEAYSYEYCPEGTTTYISGTKTIQEVVNSRQWDYIIFQNSLENSGRYETFQPYLNKLMEYCRETMASVYGREPVFGWHMFWPISTLAEDGSNSTLKYRLSFYGNSSETMFRAYCNATREMMSDTGISLVIPSGTAMQNMRRTSLNTEDAMQFTRDMYHASTGAGRYVAGCTWFESIIKPLKGISVLGNSYFCGGSKVPVTAENAALIQKCAVAAVESPFEVVLLESFSDYSQNAVD